ncbi:hypothetical protein BsWGS_23996 [Bradybaena similaris]
MRLKDKNTSVPDKLKLAKFAWVTDTVHIPNKYQQILDFICGLLVNRKKHNITSDETVLIWQTLDKFLDLAGAASVVKSSILQAVTDDLKTFILKDKPHQTAAETLLLLHVLKSLQKLLHLQSVTNFQFENLCTLLSLVCKLMVSVDRGSQLDTELQPLLQSLLAVLIRNQRSHLNQVQVLNCVTEKVLSVGIQVLEHFPCPEMQQFLLGCLLHRDHQEAYAAHLRHSFGEPDQGHAKQVPKCIGNVFTVLSVQLQGKESSAAASLIPEFTKIFVMQNKSDPRLCYLLLKQMVKIVTPAEDSGDKFALEAVTGAVNACSDCDMFGASDEKNDVMKWFLQLTDSLLQKPRSATWFSYLRAVLSVNHLVVERFWAQIFNLGFANSDKIPEECYPEQDLFLTDLVSIYLKLRRTPDLLSGLMSAVEMSSSGTDVFAHLPHFCARLGYMFSEVPLGSLLDMWETLQAVLFRIAEKLKSQEEDSSYAYTRLHWLFSFYTVLLGNARLFSHHSMGVLGQRVTVLINELENILLLLKTKKGVAKSCPSLRALLEIWANVKILFLHKGRGAVELLMEQPGGKVDGSIEKLLQTLDPVSKLKLVVQRTDLATDVNPESTDDQKIRQMVEKVVGELLNLPELSRDLVFQTWKDQDNGTTVLEQPLRQFQKCCELFPLVRNHLPEKLINKLVSEVVKVLSYTTLEDNISCPAEGTSLFGVVSRFLAHPTTREVTVFQERLSIAIWKHLLSRLDHTAVSPKKKKKRPDSNVSGSDLSTVIDLVTNCQFGHEKCTLDLTHIRADLQMTPDCAVMVQELKKLDLECLHHVSLQCQIGACILIACLSRSPGQEGFQNLVVELLIQCLTIPNLSRLFEYVKPTDLLDVVLKICSKGTSLDLQLLSVTVQAIMNDFEAVPSMVVYVKQMTSDICNSCNLESLIRMKAVAWFIKNCQRYTTESFHMSKIRSAALEIFFTLAKFLVKNGLKWFEKVKLAQSLLKREKPVFEQRTNTKKRKHKMDAECEKQEPSSLETSEDVRSKAWCCVLECVTELLHSWSKNTVDDDFNEHLCKMVSEILEFSMIDLKSGHLSVKTTITELAFINACCYCHMRCNNTQSSEMPAGRSSSSPGSVQSPTNLCLFPGRRLEEIWTICLSLCTSELSKQIRIPRRPLECQEQTSSLHREYTQHTHTDTSCLKTSVHRKELYGAEDTIFSSVHRKELSNAEDTVVLNDAELLNVSSHDVDVCLNSNLNVDIVGLSESARGLLMNGGSQMSQVANWSAVMSTYISVLTSVLECSDMSMFRCILDKMMGSLAPASEVEAETIHVIMAVWRRLIKSQCLPENLVQEMFSSMYQFLSVVLSLLQFHEKSVSTSSPSGPTTPLHNALKSILDALSDFVDLGKKLITPRMALVCFDAGLIFTLVCPSDLDAVYRLTNTLLVHHTNTALRAVPTIICITNKMISSCIQLGSSDRLAGRPALVTDLVRSAQLITRLLTLLSSPAYKTDLSKVAHSILAEYLLGVQRGSLHMAVKKELVRGLYKVMSICDKFRLASLNASLPAGVKDNFKVLHQDYEKYHRYSGFV